ncbi:MAG: metallophosphoesterase [Ornithinibacter sp.]
MRALRPILAAATLALVAFTTPLSHAVGAPGAEAPHLVAAEQTPQVAVAAHVADLGWMPETTGGATAGTTGRSLALQALRIATTVPSGTIRFRAHVARIGWQPWATSPATMGTTGRSLAIEAVQMTLTGDAASRYAIEYRAHVSGIGWQPWSTDGSVAGTTGQHRSIEAVQVRLAPMVRIAVTADSGMEAPAQGVFDRMGTRKAGLNLILGDLSYQPIGREPAFCAMVNSRVAGPTLVVAGNHEDTTTRQGTIENFARCLPDRVGVTGTYGKDYWVDSGPVRVILISADISLSTGTKSYRRGTAEAAWLTDTIRQGRAQGQWVVVGMHKPCLTLGVHGCASSRDLSDLLFREGVDVVLAGHDHNYSRSHQIRGTTTSPVIVDRDARFAHGAGTVLAVVGNGGHEARQIAPQTAIWAAANGTNSRGGFVYGFVEIDATPAQLTYRLVRTAGGTMNDSFTITRP